MAKYRYVKNALFIDTISGKTVFDELLFSSSDGLKIISQGRSAKTQIPDGALISSSNGRYVCPSFVDSLCRIGGLTTTNRRLGGELKCAESGGYGKLRTVFPDGAYPDTPAKFENHLKFTDSLGLNCSIIQSCPIKRGTGVPTLVDMKDISSLGCRIFTDDPCGFIPSSLLYRAMTIAAKEDLLILLSCHDSSLEFDGEYPDACELSAVSRAIIFSKETGARTHICRVSRHKSVEMIRRAKSEGVRITCSTSPGYFSCTEKETLFRGALAKLSPPLGTQRDVTGVIEGLSDGTIDCIESDHATLSKDAKTDFSTAPCGSAGFETALAAGITYLVRSGRMTLFELIKAMSSRPYEILIGKKLTYRGLGGLGLSEIDTSRGQIYSKNVVKSGMWASLFDGAYLYGMVTERFT